ncbi:10710_t:CDS:2, partial [Acaulospora morrowiae]
MSSSDSRSSQKHLKPIIYHNGIFHYIENNSPSRFDDNTKYSLFQIYNLNRSFEELKSEIIEAVGGNVNVTLEDELSVPPMVDPDNLSSSSSNMEDSYVTVGGTHKKVKITFKNHRHRDVVENIRSSDALKSFTENGFADWIPLDLATYNNIERSSKCDHQDHGLHFRSFSDEIDENTLYTIVEELINNNEESALKKLFPGSTVKIHREIRNIKMKVFFVEIRYHFEYEFGKLVVEVLNAIIHDRRINADNEVVHYSFFKSILYLTFLIGHMLFINELYEEL